MSLRRNSIQAMDADGQTYRQVAAITENGSRVPFVGVQNGVSRLRDLFDKWDNKTWQVRQTGFGDLILMEGNVVGASYLTIVKDVRNQNTETVIESIADFDMPLRFAFAVTASQRILGQELSAELVGAVVVSANDENRDIDAMAAAAPVAIASVSQTTTTLTVTTATPHGLKPGQRISITGVLDSRANYPHAVVAQTPSPTVFVVTTLINGNIPSVTIASTGGFVHRVDPLGWAKDGISWNFDGTSASTFSYHLRTGGGENLPSGTAAGSQSVSGVSNQTSAPQAVNTAGAYAFMPMAIFENLYLSDHVSWNMVSADSPTAGYTTFKRTQGSPDPSKRYKVRFRAKNAPGLTVPVANIVSATKTGTTTATIVTETPHGLAVGDVVQIFGLRDQTNFPNVSTATAIASVVDATTFTIVQGSASSSVSYGGTVIRVNGGQATSALAQVGNAISRTGGVYTLIGSGNWSGVSIGEHVQLLGVRDAAGALVPGVPSTPLLVSSISTTTITLIDPLADVNNPAADFASVNCGAAVLKCTDYRLHMTRLMDFTRTITETYQGMGRPDSNQSVPVLVANSPTVVAGSTSGTAAHDAAVSGNPVRVGAHGKTSQPAVSATGDTVDVLATLSGAVVNKPYSVPEADWSAMVGAGGLTVTTAQAIKAGAAGLRNYLTGMQLVNTGATATEVTILDGSTVLWRVKLPANMSVGWDMTFPSPLKTTAAAALNIQCSAASEVYWNAQGYQAP